MQNEMRDRLVELIKQAKQNTKNANCDLERNMLFADYLIEHGVIVPPCKVGDVLYEIVDVPHTAYKPFVSAFPLKVEPYQIIYRNILGKYACIPFEKFGKTVFLTKEEAEKALKEGADND